MSGRWREDRGAALVTAMGLIVIVLMIGVSAARAAFSAEKSARIERDRLVAFAAAEAALLDAQMDIEAGTRAALFDGSGNGFAEGCRSAGASRGLCKAAGPSEPPAWQAAALDEDDAAEFGEFTGALMPTAAPGQSLRLPRYVIEPLPAPPSATAGALYRITAIGFGTREGTLVVLQAVHHKAAVATPGHGGPPLPPGRLAWREIANWPELHDAATK